MNDSPASTPATDPATDPTTDPATDPTTDSSVRPDVLAILRCPVTRSRLRQEGEWLIAEVGGLAYPVRDGIPVMLPEEAKLPPGIASLDEFRHRFAPGST